MPDSFKELANTISAFLSDSIVAIGIALFGGAVNAMNNKPAKWSWGWFVTGLFTAAFAGVIVSCALDSFDIAEKMKVAIVGMAGYAANDLLVALKKRLIDAAGGDDK